MISYPDHQSIVQQYRDAAKRIIFLDYDGTLVPFTKKPENSHAGENIMGMIHQLLSDEKNTIVIISGRDKDFIEKEFGQLNIILVAEHGYLSRDHEQAWHSIMKINTSWKLNVKPILQKYVDRCKGSFIEEKQSSFAWHYRNADQVTAVVQLEKLKEGLMEILTKQKDLSLLEGNKVLEIKSNKYNKGLAAFHYVSEAEYGFILAIGDDETDEDIFNVLPKNAVTIKIGREPSKANYYLEEQAQVFEFIQSLYL